MANWDLQLVLATIRAKAFQRVQEAGVTARTLGIPEAQMCWDFLTAFYGNPKHFGENVSEELLHEQYPTVELPEPKQSLEALIERVLRDKLQRDVAQLLDEAGGLNEDDPAEAFSCLAESLSRMSELRKGGDVDFADGLTRKIRQEYAQIKEHGGVGLWPWPWRELTEAIGNIERGGLYAFWGIPKSGKTWLALLCAVYLYKYHGLRGLIYSAEMHVDQLRRRVALLLAELDYDSYRKGKLSEAEEELLYGYLEYIEQEAQANTTHARLIFTTGLSRSAEMSIRELRGKIETYKPDFVVLDSAYHLAKGPDWKFITELSQRLKQELCTVTGIPAFAVIQENERQAFANVGKGRGSASVAMSPSWVQDMDGGFRVINNGNGFASIQVSAGREFKSKGAGIRIHFEPASNFDFVDRKLEDVLPKEEDAPQAASPQPQRIQPPQRQGGVFAKDRYG